MDLSGDAYITGYTISPDFPVTPDAFQSSYGGGTGNYGDAFLTKFNPMGSGLIYSSYLGGTGDDGANAVAVDQTGDAYIAGHTASVDLPVTFGALQTAMKGSGDAFVTKFPLGGQFRVLQATPNIAGNTGQVSITVYGSGLHLGLTVKLTGGGSDIPGTQVNIGPYGRSVTASFDLTGAAPGPRDVVVTSPDGTVAVLPSGFEVWQGGAPHIWVDIVSYPNFLVGVEQTVRFVYGNDGNVDALGVPITISVPITASVDLRFPITPPPSFPGDPAIDWTQFSPIVQTQAAQLIPLFIPVIPAGQSGSLEIGLTLAYNVPPHSTFTLGVFANAPYFNSLNDEGQGLSQSATCGGGAANMFSLASPNEAGQGIITDSTKCVLDIVNTTLAALSIFFPGVSCAPEVLFTRTFLKFVRGGIPPNTIGSMLQLTVSVVATIATCVLKSQADIFRIYAIASTLYGGYLTLQDCVPIAEKLLQAQAIAAGDPNYIGGPAGVGTQGWIPGSEMLGYLIAFENEPDASAPAHQVVVTNSIDPNSDLNTLQLAGINLVGIQVPLARILPVVGQNEFATVVDLRPTQNLLIDVDAKIDPATRILTWTFVSIDPITGQPPTDPMVGFLPPQGQGTLGFSVQPKQSLATGAQIQDQAVVVFDANPPISTAVWLNTIDNTPPTSQVAALPPTENTASFKVQWSGIDQGSGIQDYTVYASDNGGPFTAFLVNTAATSTSFTGQAGHTYGFYSIARDLVGNVENPKTAAEATTQATLGAPPSLKISPTSLAFGLVVVGSTSASKTIKLTHRGPTVPLLTISSITTSGDYSQANDCPGTLDPGKSCTLTVTFTPNVAGALNGVISVYDSFSNSPQVVPLTGTGLAAVSAAPVSLNLSSPVGSTSNPGTVTVTNSTAADVSLSYSASATFSGAPGLQNGCGSTLAANSSCAIAVTFTPEQPGTIYGSLAITGAFPTQVVDLTGTATGGTLPTLVFSPAKLTFKTPQLVGTTGSPLTVTVANKGTAAVVISGLVGSTGFTATPSGTKPCSGSLAAGAKCTFQVTFTPPVIGATKGSVSVANSGAINPLLYDVSGTGVNAVSFSPASLTFLAQTVGTTSAPKTVTLFNNQPVVLNLASTVASGDYAAVPGGTNPCGSAVAANSSCTFVVSFSPTKIGAIKGVVTVADDAPTSPQLVGLTGKGQ